MEEAKYPSRSNGYTLLSQIGSGAFATVFSADVVATHEKVSIKILPLEEITFNLEEIRNEIKTLRMLKHENIVPIHTSFVDEDELWIVMPLMEAGSCARILKSTFTTGIKDESVVLRVLQQLLIGLKYIHTDGNIHRDVKAGNILISKEGDVKLADFGVAGTLTEQGQRRNNRNTFVGTPCWMAPEVMEQQDGYNQKADIWSVGITALELAYGRAPYALFPPMKVLILTLQEEPPTADIYKDPSYKFSSDFHKFVAKCLRKDPKDRRSAEGLLEKFDKLFKKACTKEELRQRIVVPSMATIASECKDVRGMDRSARRKDSRKMAPVSWNFGDFASMKKAEIQAQIGETAPPKMVDTQSHKDSGEYREPRTPLMPLDIGAQPILSRSSTSDLSPVHVLAPEKVIGRFKVLDPSQTDLGASPSRDTPPPPGAEAQVARRGRGRTFVVEADSEK